MILENDNEADSAYPIPKLDGLLAEEGMRLCVAEMIGSMGEYMTMLVR